MSSAGKIMLIVFWDSQGVLLAHFQKRGENVILHHTVKSCWYFGMQFVENVQANWQEAYCFFVTMPDPIQPKQPSREFKNYSGNFLKICLTARSWSLVTSSVWSAKIPPWWQMFHWRRKVEMEVWMWLRQQSKDIYAAGWRISKVMGQVYQCWWRICQEISVFSRFKYHMFYVLYPFMTYLLTLPRISTTCVNIKKIPFCPSCVVFHVILTINTNYFHKQHLVFVIEIHILMWGRKMSTCYLNELQVSVFSVR
jgi:hypothetical protein